MKSLSATPEERLEKIHWLETHKKHAHRLTYYLSRPLTLRSEEVSPSHKCRTQNAALFRNLTKI